MAMHSASTNMYSGGSRPGHRVSGTRSKVPNLNENGEKSHFLQGFSGSEPSLDVVRLIITYMTYPNTVDQFTIAISNNTDVTKLKHHTGLSQAACD